MTYELFSPGWCRTFATAWNQAMPLHRWMAGSGEVLFERNPPKGMSCILTWDHEGKVAVAGAGPRNVRSLPAFSAADDVWAKFLRGELKAVPAVMSGRIRYSGPMAFALRFGASFDRVGELARQLADA